MNKYENNSKNPGTLIQQYTLNALQFGTHLLNICNT